MSQHAGYTKEWLANGRILCLHFNSLGGTTTEEWYTEMLLNYDTFRQRNERILVLLDLRNTGNLLSAEGMLHARRISEKFSDLEGRVAVLVNVNQNYRNLKMFVERGLNSTARERDLFEDEQAAINWLLSE
jgi:hypothetical protein